MRKGTVSFVITLLIILSFAVTAFAEEIAKYPVRWKHGGKTDFGTLKITTSSIVFIGDEGENKALPYLYVEKALIVDGIWIQIRSNRESGFSLGMDDVYNFGVVGGKPDPAIIKRVNDLILGSKNVRISSAVKLEGEVSRYMVSKGETFGDDVGILIITETSLIYHSDTNGKDHNWKYADLNGVEITKSGQLNVMTKERSIIKAGLSRRNYAFVSQTVPFKSDDISFIIAKIMDAPAQ